MINQKFDLDSVDEGMPLNPFLQVRVGECLTYKSAVISPW